jgi:archaellum component FlaG (FlaF/FlaG flagellin family)
MKYSLYRTILLFVAGWFFLSPNSAGAVEKKPVINDSSYQGVFVKQSISDPISIEAGSKKQITVIIKNTGSALWEVRGSNFVSVYTTEPSYRKSLFVDKTWISASQPVKLGQAVKPQENGFFTFWLVAPKIPGTYTEHFQLAAENKTWIKGAGFYLKIIVKEQANAVLTSKVSDGFPVGSIATVSDTPVSGSSFRASVLPPNPPFVQLTGGETARVIFDFKNTGSSTWHSYALEQSGVEITRSNSTVVIPPSFVDASWVTSQKVVTGSSEVQPDEILRIEFSIRAPASRGEYVSHFNLKIDNSPLSKTNISLPVIVSEDAPFPYQHMQGQSPRVLISEPSIRVGLYKTNKEVVFRSIFPYSIFSGLENKGILVQGQELALSYSEGKYSVRSPDTTFVSSEAIRLVPGDLNSFFEIKNYNRTYSGSPGKNFNAYRGILEYAFSPKSVMPYVVNELPLDQYVAGIAEVSNGVAIEYMKAVLVAARSYAYQQIISGVPKDKRMFDVYASTIDQLYLGYNSELTRPRVAQAAHDTYGEMVTYENNPVVTPYFSHADGHTRSWKEVWGGADKPWLQSVVTQYDVGKAMSGHGVGMSNYDASFRAAKDGWTYDQILKHYYSGTEKQKIY